MTDRYETKDRLKVTLEYIITEAILSGVSVEDVWSVASSSIEAAKEEAISIKRSTSTR